MLLTATSVTETPENFKQAEIGLLQQTNGDSVLWSGRAATSLYLAYQLAKLRRSNIKQGEVIMPAMMCATASNVAHIAGLTPRFADVSAETGLITLETVQARLTPNTIAVVVIHLLGHTVDIDPIAQFCKEHDLLLIEDPTQALGAIYPDGRAVGSVGDVTVYSFNGTKIINKGNGVLISRLPEITHQLQTILSELRVVIPPDPDTYLQLALSYRNLHHSLVGLLRLDDLPQQQVSDAFMAVRHAYEPLYLKPANPDVDLNQAWADLPDTLAHRLKLANIYADRLQHDNWQLLIDFQSSGVCWRFSLLINNPDKQVAFSEAVRQDGFHVSNLYWAVNQFFRPSDVCEGADAFGRRIVNLWVDTSVDEEYVNRCCDSLLAHADMLTQ